VTTDADNGSPSGVDERGFATKLIATFSGQGADDNPDRG
jgi:hypothetical protein